MAYITEYSELGPKERRQLKYKRQYKADRPEWEDSMERLKIELAKRLPPDADVLDAGCGRANYVLDELAGFWGRKVGIDVAEEHTTGNTSVNEIVFGTLDDLPFEQQMFDVVVSLWVLEHISCSGKEFAEIARVLKPGGLFGFTTPNKKSALILLRRMMSDSLAEQLVYRIYGREEADTFPVKYEANSLSDLWRLAAQHGFAVEYLAENTDPSYTSFDPVSYAVSKRFSQLPSSLARPHIVGVLRRL